MAEAKNRGHEATTPIHIPARGWRDILGRAWKGIASKNLGIVSAGVAFYALLAIFPGLAALVSICGLVANPADVQSLVDFSGQVLPGDANKLISDQMTGLLSKPGSGLTFAAIGGILFALWSAHSGTNTLMTALNIAYGENERRGYVRRNLLALGLTLGGILFVMLALALVALLPVVLRFLALDSHTDFLVSAIRWPVLAILVMGALATAYRLGPSREKPKWRWVSPGAIVTTILWLFGSGLFSFYVSRFGSYDKTYGSLGAVIVLLMWLYISGYIVLIGAEINAESERQTRRDTTTGPEMPAGQRGAAVADTHINTT